MAQFLSDYRNYIIPRIIIIGGFLTGILIEKLILIIIKRITRRIKWEGENPIVKALKGEIVISCVMIGIYISGFVLDLPAQLKALSEKS